MILSIVDIKNKENQATKKKKNHNVCGKAETKNNKNTFIRTLVLK